MSAADEHERSLTARGTPVAFAADIWDHHASWWRETFAEGADLEYAQEVMPLIAASLTGAQRILDVGCGEGQVARLLHRSPHHPQVTGIDPSGNQLENARRNSPAEINFVQGAGEHLPFPDGAFDAVVCCLAIEHCADVDAVLAEVARVLDVGGRFLLLINHPLYQGAGSGFIDDQILGEHYWRVGPYLRETVSFEEVDQGVSLPFAHRPLSRYLNPLASYDLLLVEMHEPPPLADFLAGSIDPELEGAIPRLLALHFEHRPRPRH